mmetsp:Transcript_3883/g.5338  ORF Transcript_3883/g.5338 Transcript_3883/m.5338 type:complete len:216 (-) Transcript_3883:31-678(-)
MQLLQTHTIPPPELAQQGEAAGSEMVTDFVYMGFPKRVFDASSQGSYCFDGKRIRLASNSYICPRCHVRATDIPTQCCVCGLQMNSSSHIARSHHHLFPVPNFIELTIQRHPDYDTKLHSKGSEWIAIPFQDTNSAISSDKMLLHRVMDEATSFCAGCCASLLPTFIDNQSIQGISSQSSSTSSVFQCPNCDGLFCPECDVFIHEFLHNCPHCHC